MRLIKCLALGLFLILNSTVLFSAENKTREKPLLPLEEIITLKTSDNQKLTGSFFYPEGCDMAVSASTSTAVKKYPVVMLIHMWKRNRYEWAPLIPPLQKAGYAVIAVTMRVNTQNNRDAENDPTQSLIKMSRDVLAAYSYLKNKDIVDINKLHIVGASIGSTLGIQITEKINIGLNKEKPVRSLTVISPAINYFFVPVGETINNCTATPIYFVLERNDPDAKHNSKFKSGKKLFDMYLGEKILTIYTDIGHGTLMLSQPTLIDSILDWIRTNK